MAHHAPFSLARYHRFTQLADRNAKLVVKYANSTDEDDDLPF